MPRAAFPMSASVASASGAVLAQWFEATARLLKLTPRPVSTKPESSVSEAARLLSARAHAGQARIRDRYATFHAKLKAEHDAGWPGPKVSG